MVWSMKEELRQKYPVIGDKICISSQKKRIEMAIVFAPEESLRIGDNLDIDGIGSSSSRYPICRPSGV